jgi:GNAT superfamily N-acetyltransferase
MYLSQSLAAAAKAPATYLLNETDIPHILQLYETIKVVLEKPYHLKEKTPEALQAHLQSGMKIIGVYDQGKLVGSVMLTEIDKAPDTAKIFPEIPHTTENASIVIMQMLMVHPDHCKRGIAGKMHEEAQKIYPEALFLAKVATDNQKSLNSFASKGFQKIEPPLQMDEEYLSYFLVKKPSTQIHFVPAALPTVGVVSGP